MVSRIYEYDHELIGEDLPENYIFCIFHNDYFDEVIGSNLGIATDSEYDIGTVLFIYQTDLSFEDLTDIKDAGGTLENIPYYIEDYYPNNEWTYIGQITISNDGGNEIILDENTTDVSLVINNKIVSNIINNSNNKIIDSILMNGNIIYKRKENNVSEKIDTQFVESKSELWLQDINGNGLRGKNIIYQACDNNTLTTLTKNSGFSGGTFLSPTNIKCVVFEGDEEYNGCSYENSNFKGCGGLTPYPKG